MEVGRLMEVQFILDRSGSKQDFTDSIARGGGGGHPYEKDGDARRLA